MLKRTLHHVFKSVTDISWYKYITQLPLREHLQAFLLVMCLSSLLSTVFVFTQIVPTLIKNIRYVSEQSKTAFPDDLHAQWSNPTLTLSKPELTLPIPDMLAEGDPLATDESIFIVAQDLNEEEVSQRLEQHEIILDRTTLYSRVDGQLYTIPLTELFNSQNFEFTKSTLEASLTTVNNLLPHAWLASIAFFFFMCLFLISIRLINLFMDTVLLYILSRLSSFKLSFKDIFVICLNVLFPTELIFAITLLYTDSSYTIRSITFWLYLTIVMVYHYQSYQRNHTQKA